MALFALPRVNEIKGSGMAEINTRSTLPDEKGQMKPQENEKNSQTNRSTSANEDSIADNSKWGSEDRADAPDKDDLVG